jgi:hypothetical protein
MPALIVLSQRFVRVFFIIRMLGELRSKFNRLKADFF